MANTKSANKKIRQSARRHEINLARRTSVKTAVKKVLTALSNGENVEVVKDLLHDAESQLSRAKNKLFHKNTISRKISRLSKKVLNYSKNKNVETKSN